MDTKELRAELTKNGWFEGDAYIGGEWIKGANRFEVTDPYSGELIGTAADCSVKECEQAIRAANEAFEGWSSLTANKRGSLLYKWYELIKKYSDLLAYLLTMEQGKVLSEAKSEILYGASFVKWFAAEAERAYGDVIPTNHIGKRMTVIQQPVGVCAAITPWNFPNAMITRKIAPALAAGCTIILKPSDETPYSALALCKLAEEAGFPKGVINVVLAKDPVPIGEALTSNKTVKKISFTGSTAVGKWLMEKSAPSLKRISLELGGNAPLVVFEDADLDMAVKGALASKYRNNGQTCICSNRILVHDRVYSSFVAKMSDAVANMNTGSGFDPSNQTGPLINSKASDKVQRLVNDAMQKGAQMKVGQESSATNLLWKPSLLTNVTPEMDIFKEEIFGPVAPVYRFSSDEEAASLANDTQYGLASYFYTRDISRAWKFAERLEYGMVGVNETGISNAAAPFGGIKESGFGREGSKYGIEEYLDKKYVCFGVE